MSESWHPRKTEKDVAVARAGVAKYDRGWKYGAGTRKHDHSKPGKGGEVLKPEQINNITYVQAGDDLQAVLDNNNGLIILSEGTWTGTYTIKFSDTHIRGVLGKTILKAPNGASAPVLESVSGLSNISVEGLVVDGNTSGGATSGGIIFYADNTHTYVRRCEVKNIGGGAGATIRNYGSMEHVYVHDCDNWGVGIDSNYLRLSNILVENTAKSAYEFTYAKNVTATNLIGVNGYAELDITLCEDSTFKNIYMEGGAGSVVNLEGGCKNVEVSNVIGVNSAGSAINSTTTNGANENVEISKFIFINCTDPANTDKICQGQAGVSVKDGIVSGSGGTTDTPVGWAVYGFEVVQDVDIYGQSLINIGIDDAYMRKIKDNHVETVNQQGINIARDARKQVIGNTVKNNNQGGYTDHRSVGILIGRTTSITKGVLVMGNYVYDDQATKTQEYGIGTDLGSGAVQNTVIKNNHLVGNNTGAFYSLGNILAGSGTVVKDCVGVTLENGGEATFSGDGTTTTFTIAHGLADTPGSVKVTPGSADADGDFYVTVDATDITVTFASAPATGTDNVVLWWNAEV